jgi:Na+/H+-dicarboxylate symporter
MPFILLGIILIVFFIESSLPLGVKEAAYGISVSIKNIILFMLPWIIFSLLFKSAYTLSSSATKVIGLLLFLICASNTFTALWGGGLGYIIYTHSFSFAVPHVSRELMPSFELFLPPLIPNDYAMFSGLLSGIVLTRFKPQLSKKICAGLSAFVNICLPAIIVMMPVFVAGFMIKLVYEGTLVSIFKDYLQIFVIIAMIQVVFILLSFGAVSKFHLSLWAKRVKNLLPAWMSGISTMSSAATLPLTILGAQKNAKDPVIPPSVMPATVNVHLIGDSLAIPIFAFAVMKSYQVDLPSFWQFGIFLFYFVVSKFSIAAVPGGGILVMLPLLQKYLGFEGEMIPLITALYILFDPIITGANILGNGYFALLFEKISGKVGNSSHSP